MWNLSSTALAQSDPGTAFILLRWDELLNPETPDSFRPRLHDVRTLLAELADVALLATEDQRYRRHCQIICEELRHTLPGSPYGRSLPPQQVWQVEEACSQVQPQALGTDARVLLDKLPDIRDVSFALVETTAFGLPHRKKAMCQALRLLAHLSLWEGYDSADFAHFKKRSLLALPPDKAIAKLLSRLARKKQEYSCTLTLSGHQNIVRFIARHLGANAELVCAGHTADPHSLRYRVVASSFRSAATASVATIKSIVRVITAYNNARPVRINPTVVVTETGSDQERRIDLESATLSSLRPRRHGLAFTGKFLEAVGAGIDKTLEFSLEHYSLAHDALDPAMRLLSLWSGLEGLTASSPAPGGVGARIAASVSPIVAWRRLDRNLRYFCIQLHNYMRASGTRLEPGLFPLSQGDAVSIGELLLAFARQDRREHLKAIGCACAHNPLLTYRAFELHRLLRSPVAVANAMQVTTKRVTWQMDRIYRARNLIAHGHSAPQEVALLVDHLHYYYSLTAMRVIHDMTKQPGWTTAHSLRSWQLKYAWLTKALLAAAPHVCVHDVVPESGGFDREAIVW